MESALAALEAYHARYKQIGMMGRFQVGFEFEVLHFIFSLL